MRISASALKWMEENLDLRESDASASLYDHMESQSGEQLAYVYRTFNGRIRSHFRDRGQILDFGLSVGKGRILDFGPGDGWPSLSMAGMVEEVVGVDGSARRVDVCMNSAYPVACQTALQFSAWLGRACRATELRGVVFREVCSPGFVRAWQGTG